MTKYLNKIKELVSLAICFLLRWKIKVKLYGRFPKNDFYWICALDFLLNNIDTSECIIAPNDFLDIFPYTFPPRITYKLENLENINWVLIHKAEIKEFDEEFLNKVVQEYTPVFANRIFVVYTNKKIKKKLSSQSKHLKSFISVYKLLMKEENVRKDQENSLEDQIKSSFGIVVTTHNRPHVLKRSLPQITALGASVIIVDDGSDEKCYKKNYEIAQENNVPMLRIAENRGLPCAVNMGVSYWLADPKINWISCFNDDVDVKPDLLTVMSYIQDPDVRPLCTGYDASEHVTHKKTIVNGYPVLMKRSTPGIHIHAHRDYWRAVMPIPTPYLGAPKQNRGIKGQGSDGDWWVASWAPNSAAKKNIYIACVPNLVKTFAVKPEQSTWGGGTVDYKNQN